MYPIVKPTLLVFGYPGSCPGTLSAFPKVRLVLMIEAATGNRSRLLQETLLQRCLTGTHLIVDAVQVSLPPGANESEPRNCCAQLPPVCCRMWDRGLHSYGMVNTTLAQGCHYHRKSACLCQIRGRKSFRGWVLFEERLPQTASRRKKAAVGFK